MKPMTIINTLEKTIMLSETMITSGETLSPNFPECTELAETISGKLSEIIAAFAETDEAMTEGGAELLTHLCEVQTLSDAIADLSSQGIPELVSLCFILKRELEFVHAETVEFIHDKIRQKRRKAA